MSQPGVRTTWAPVLLAFPDPLQSLQTKPLESGGYGGRQGKQPPAAGLASVSPEWLAELSFQRTVMSSWLANTADLKASSGISQAGAGASGSGGGGVRASCKCGASVDTADRYAASATSQGVVEAMASFAGRLHGLVDAVVDLPGFKADWASPLAKPAGKMYRLESLSQELAMVYVAYGAGLRQLALQRIAELASPFYGSAAQAAAAAADASGGATPTAAAAAGGSQQLLPEAAAPSGSSSGGQGGGAAAAASSSSAAAAGGFAGAMSLLRQAAGVYAYLAAELLPRLGGMGAVTERPVELNAMVCRALSQLCLAEAQAIMAMAGAAKGNAPGTLAMLHAGCAALYKAAATHKDEAFFAGLPLGDRMTRYLAASAHVQLARAYGCLAADSAAKMELGVAESCCVEGERLLGLAAKDVERADASWTAWIKAEEAALAAQLVPIRKDRLAVTYQPLPKEGPPDAAVGAKALATPVEFAPAPAAPPAPAPAPPAPKQGCALM